MSTTVPLPATLDDVTADWVTQVLAERHPGVSCSSVAVTDVVTGSAIKGRLALAFDVPGDVPASLYLKGGLGGPMTQLAGGAYVTEARFFLELADQLPVRRPRCFWAGYDATAGEGLVLLEDLGRAGVTFGRAATPVTVDQAAATLELHARLHARWWDDPVLDTTPWLHAAGLRHVIGVLLSPGHWDRYLALRSEVVPEALRDRDAVRRAVETMWQRDEAGPRCLLHGDAHLDNMYFTPGGDPALLDWQTAQRGPWVHDVAYFLIGALDVDDRRANERDLLRHYLQCLGAAGVDAPPFAEAFDAYRRHVWHGFLWWLTPTEMQPDETSRIVGRRFTTAAVDLDGFDAVRGS